jgi:glycosyltransferase involved in cell wall biosynthesis
MISFAITTHNEGQYIQELLDQLVPHCEQTGDEIVVVDDHSTDAYTSQLLYGYEEQDKIKLFSHALNNDFAAHKNHLNSMCQGDYIFQVDADEKFHPNLLTYLHDIVYNNTNVELFLIPRVNTVEGLTEDDIKRWGWRVDERNRVQWPDYQTRLYRNSPDIKWEGKVHEQIIGYQTHAPLPAEEEWALYHIKNILRQREQNAYYDTIAR